MISDALVPLVMEMPANWSKKVQGTVKNDVNKKNFRSDLTGNVTFFLNVKSIKNNAAIKKR